MQDRILIVDDEHLQRWALRQQLARCGYEVIEASNASSALENYTAQLPDVVVLDLRLGADSGLDVLKGIRAFDPGAVVIMLTAHGALDAAVAAFKSGLFDFVTKPVDLEVLKLAIRNGIEARRLRTEVQRLREPERRQAESAIVGKSAAIRAAIEMIRKLAASGTRSVLLVGESGTGKDLFAKVLHYEGPHAAGPFVPVNCAAIPETLLESELFGYEKGAFTDARALKKGVFELADGGTLYLDEISELKPSLQAKLLRVLETLTFRRLGGTRDVSVDVRIIAATNCDIDAAVAAGCFRPDLLYRLRVIEMVLPALRTRKDDIPLLVDHFIRHFSQTLHKRLRGVTPEAMDLLMDYDWPGNVRELRNAIERAGILEESDLITAAYLPVQVRMPADPQMGRVQIRLPEGGLSLERVEDELVKQAIESTHGNQSEAARLLGIGRDALRYKLKRLTPSAAESEDAAGE